MGETRVVLFGRSGCHLCVEARVVVAAVCAEAGQRWIEVDIDDPGPASAGRDLLDELGELVPVVEVDGVRQGFWRIDPGRLRRALAAAPGAPLR
ncbi:glutaredoxin family protein [Cellulomonas soli]|uniref:glutaredoxin family protein n=1 Tax=Cellulomonas soli TaxID=931535 RepID=UPI003F85D41D